MVTGPTMEITWIRALLLVFIAFDASIGYGIVHYTVIVPKVIYYDSPVVASVSAYGVESHSKASVTLEYTGKNDNILNTTQMKFTTDGSQNWTVTFPWESRGEKGVNLVMRSGQEMNFTHLPFADNFGYIFVQTDQPVYTPGHTVKYRVIAVDEEQRQAKCKVRIDVKNPQQTIIDRKTITADEAFKTQELTLPKEVSLGNWSISASFEGVDHMLASVQTLTFEVKEFVLPRFYTELSISPKVVTKETKTITITGSARYYFNRGVNGTAYVQLGTWDNDKGPQFQQAYSMNSVNGSFTRVLEVDTLNIAWERVPRNMRLHVKVNFTDEATGEVDTYEDTSTFISYPDYIVEFGGSKSYFRPGFNYMLQIQVLDLSKQPVPELDISITAQFQDKVSLFSEDKPRLTKLDRYGKTQLNITVPDKTQAIKFLVSIPLYKGFKPQSYMVNKYSSQSNEYIHISLAAPIQITSKEKKPGIVLLNYTKPTVADRDVSHMQDNITVLVVAKGHIVYTTSAVKKSGWTFVDLPVHLYTKATPRMRIIAYYYVARTQEYVVDSLVADTKRVCIEEINVGRKGIYKPNSNYELEVDGGPNMRVGLVAVDKAVLSLSKDKTHTLTRNLMFTKLGSHDSGTESGDGGSMDDILSNSGLRRLSLSVKTTQHKTARDYMGDDRLGSQQNDRLGSQQNFHLAEPLMSRMLESLHERAPLNTASSKEKKQENPPQTVRSYFPESWLFEDFQLPRNGLKILNLTLPSSITTWSFLAVGVSSNQGICVSDPLELSVTKLFFADVKLPNKVKRLEKVTMLIAVYNNYYYPIKVNVVVTGSDGLCFMDNSVGGPDKDTNFTIDIQPYQFFRKKLQLIPMRIGDFKVSVDLKPQNKVDCDAVEKSLHVVAEGQRVKKSITFVLDPEATNAVKSRGNRNSATVKNVYDSENKQQRTTIDLALPMEVIKGTEVCHISAFGDLMGDIINHSVMESKTLTDATIMDAEEVLGDLAPTVYALLYAKSSGLLDAKLREKSTKFVINGVVRLLKYRLANNSFALTPESKSATWLTAFVLKTLCRASSLAFIDQQSIIEAGFLWLAKQVNETSGTVDEQDWRLAKDSLEYRIMLSAEVLIAILECNKSEQADLFILQGAIFSFLEENMEQIMEPMVLAKVTYAFMLSGEALEEYTKAKERLDSMKRKDKQDNLYWSNIEETNESKHTPFWYHKGAQASAIEATAYALIIYLNHGDTNAEAIADWLVGQRNPNGAFIGAMDSTIAIQALARYSFQKHGMKVDLCCNISSDRQKNYFHSFKFTGENATHQKSLNNVPVGQDLEVLTKGQGLGQMQVNVEYNIPINKNHKCPFVITIQVTSTKVSAGQINNNPLCASCGIGCPTRNRNAVTVKVRVNKSVVARICKGKKLPYQEGSICKRLQTQKKRSSGKKEKPKDILRNKRQAWSVYGNQAVSRKSICINICLQRRKNEPAYPAGVHIEMLTGYKPVAYDIDKIKELSHVKHVVYDNTTETLRVQFTEITKRKKTCLAFRAVEEEEVDRLMPAVVEVKKPGSDAPLCVIEYHPPQEEESLQAYCTNYDNGNKGECKCFTGLCSQIKLDADLYEVTETVCRSNIAYQLQFDDNDACDEIDAKVISRKKNANDSVTVGSLVKLSKPSFCACPKHFRQNSSEKIYFLGSSVEKLVDKRGREVNRYLIDEQSTFLRFTAESNENPSQHNVFLEQAIAKCHG